MEIWQMREIIREVYTTFTWQQKVKKKMPPKQVIAVYMPFKKRKLI